MAGIIMVVIITTIIITGTVNRITVKHRKRAEAIFEPFFISIVIDSYQHKRALAPANTKEYFLRIHNPLRFPFDHQESSPVNRFLVLLLYLFLCIYKGLALVSCV